MKNIFLESHNIKNPFFGFGQFNKHLINNLIEKNNITKDFQFTLYSSKKSDFDVKFNHNTKFKKYYSFHRYNNFRIKKKFDLWHSLNQNTKIEPYFDINYLLTIHNITHIKNPQSYKEEDVHKSFQNKINKSDSIVYISNYVKKSTHDFFDVPNIPEYIIYNGNTISNKKIATKSNKHKPYLFTIGEITERKNFISLIYMIEHLKDYNLLIAGKNSTKTAENIKNVIKQKNLSDRVFLLGKVNERDKINLYHNCSAFVFPSLREGFGLPIIEAMEFNKPVFTSFNTSLPEIAGDHAFYWYNYDAKYMAEIFENGMNEFYNNKITFTKKNKENVDRFSWDKAAKEYIDIYKKLTKC